MSEEWLNQFLQAPLSDSDRSLLERNQQQLLSSGAFDGLPAFGTGGMREVVELGSNRLNAYNIFRLSKALAKSIKNRETGARLVIGYDSRLSSLAFSRITYHTLCAAGIAVKVFRRVAPTPLVSFAIRHFKATGGIVITASHNPSEYNGYKVYGNDGGQIVSPVDQQIQQLFAEISYDQLGSELHDYMQRPVSDADLVEEEVMTAFFKLADQEEFLTKENKKLKVLYSPLHGTGGHVFKEAFDHYGFTDFSLLASQAEPDGNFSNTTGLNPEESQAFKGLIEEGQKENTRLLLATDPDADRVGCAWLKNNKYEFLTGNQIGAILLASLAEKKAPGLKSPFACKTIVTSELQRHIANDYRVKMVETLTGFKYIAAAIASDPENYVFGGEESFGYLPVSFIRDKDSVTSALALAHLAEKHDLLDFLDQLYLRYGLYEERLHNINLADKRPGFMNELLDRFKNPPDVLEPGSHLAGRKVIDILDLQKGSSQPVTPLASQLKNTLPAAKVIQYWFEPEGRLTVRPSGTEPKVKIYLSLRYNGDLTPANLQQAKQSLRSEIDDVLKRFLSLLEL